nr:unnamed protein product [Naegleria fowleri]
MPQFLVRFINDYSYFRLPDLESCARVNNIPMQHSRKLREDEVFYFIELPSEEDAKKLVSRSVLIQGIYEVWGVASTPEECVQQCGEYCEKNSEHVGKILREDVSYRIVVENYGCRWKKKEMVDLLKRFTTIPWKGKVDLLNPQQEFYIFQDYDSPSIPGSHLHQDKKSSSNLLTSSSTNCESSSDGSIQNDNDLSKHKETLPPNDATNTNHGGNNSTSTNSSAQGPPTKKKKSSSSSPTSSNSTKDTSSQNPPTHQAVLKTIYFTRKIGEGGRHLITEYDLKKRKYIGTTSMNATLSFLSANMALASSKTLIYDPFVGTGSIIVSVAHYGSHVIGSDLDIRVVRGKNFRQKGNVESDANIQTNFDQYGLTRKAGLELLRVDMSQTQVWRSMCHKNHKIARPFLDAIVCDPPYGNREGPRKIGRHKPLDPNSTALERENYFPGTITYDVKEMYQDLLEFAAKSVVKHGRMVAWLFNFNEDYSEEVIPQHRCFKLLYNSLDPLNSKYHRRLLTYEKIDDYHELPDITSSSSISSEQRK